MDKHIIFQCRKCWHFLYVVIKGRTIKNLANILSKADCPNCGEEADRNWCFVGLGDFEEDYGQGEENNG